MPRPRETHRSKTLEEKHRYWNNVIRTETGPTLEDTTPIIDTTDHSAMVEKEQIGRVTTQKTPPAVFRWLREKITEIAIGAAIFLLGWVLFHLYGLNREVGELKTTHTHFESQINKVETGLSEKIGDLSSNVHRLEQRIDGFIDRHLRDRTKSNTKRQE